MRRSVMVVLWMAGAAAATAGFGAAAVHALAEVSSGELVRGPAWALVLALSVAGALLSVRVLLAVAATALGAALDALRPRGLTARRVDSVAMALAPAALRPLLCGVLVAGAAVTAASPALAAPAAAAPATAATAVHTGDRTTHHATHHATDHATHHATDDLPAPGWPALSGDWRPQAPAARGRPGVELVTSGSARCTPDGEVVVRRGDTLWDLAARSLGPGASDAEIAAAWPRWWHANRAAIGPDPDLLHPGTRLCVPHDGADRSTR